MPAKKQPLRTLTAPKPNLDSFVAVGWDQSINHAAVVVLRRDGEILDWHWYSQAVKECKDKQHSAAFPAEIRNEKDRDLKATLRLKWVSEWASGVLRTVSLTPVEKTIDSVLIGLEDYAFAAAQGSHQIGETSGAVKLAILVWPPCFLRLWAPLTLKLYATGRGDADKDSICDAVRERWKVSFPNAGKREDDLIDAYALARMTLLEADVRAGRASLQELLEQERRIFLRVTKAHPVNVLERPYLCIPR